jgi:signal transduction histidine kinase
LGRLQQVASNLLPNVLTHGLPQSPVKISARADEHDLVIEVWNAGEPIPPESLGRIFEPFRRHSASADDNLARQLMPTLQHLSPGRLTVDQTGAVDREAADLFLA